MLLSANTISDLGWEIRNPLRTITNNFLNENIFGRRGMARVEKCRFGDLRDTIHKKWLRQWLSGEFGECLFLVQIPRSTNHWTSPGVVVVVQLAEKSLIITENCSSLPSIGSLSFYLSIATKNRRQQGKRC